VALGAVVTVNLKIIVLSHGVAYFSYAPRWSAFGE